MERKEKRRVESRGEGRRGEGRAQVCPRVRSVVCTLTHGPRTWLANFCSPRDSFTKIIP